MYAVDVFVQVRRGDSFESRERLRRLRGGLTEAEAIEATRQYNEARADFRTFATPMREAD